MNKISNVTVVMAAVCLSVGLIALGFIIKGAALDIKGMERTVQVKGLAERDLSDCHWCCITDWASFFNKSIQS